jgi:capsular polysaccharide biosynthesis protein
MDLEDIIRQLVKRWYLMAFLIVVAVAGCYMYHYITGKKNAVAVVAVKQPVTAAPGEYIPPVITFETLDESMTLAQRVADRLNDGSLAKDLKGNIDIKIQISSEPSLTPLYDVSYSDPSKSRALQVSAIVLDEARKLYTEINQPDPVDIRAAFDPEVQRLEDSVTDARAQLSAYERDNDAFELSKQIDQVSGFMNDLRTLRLQLGVQSSNFATQGRIGSQTVTDANISSIDDALDEQQTELARLKDLEPRWTELNLNVSRLEDQLTAMRHQVESVIAGQALPAQGSVEVMSQPAIKSNLFFMIVTYGLSLIIALFLGLTIIYLMAVFDRRPLQPIDLEKALGVPVLAHVHQEVH